VNRQSSSSSSSYSSSTVAEFEDEDDDEDEHDYDGVGRLSLPVAVWRPSCCSGGAVSPPSCLSRRRNRLRPEATAVKAARFLQSV